MSDQPQPKPVQLGPPGLYSLPSAEECPGLVLAEGRLPTRIHFVLEDGTQFHLPTKDIALERLYRVLKARFEPPGDFVRIHEVSEIPRFDWDDKGENVSAQFPYRDGISTALSIPAQLLESLREEVVEAIARRPPGS